MKNPYPLLYMFMVIVLIILGISYGLFHSLTLAERMEGKLEELNQHFVQTEVYQNTLEDSLLMYKEALRQIEENDKKADTLTFTPSTLGADRYGTNP